MVQEVLPGNHAQKRGVLQSTIAKALPLKARVFFKMVDMLLELAQQSVPVAVVFLQTIKNTPSDAISSLAGLNRSPQDGRPWILVLTFANNPEGRASRDHWSAAQLTPPFQKTNGAWPAVSIKVGQWRSSKLYSQVCEDVGWAAPNRRRSPGVKRGSASPATVDGRSTLLALSPSMARVDIAKTIPPI